MNEGVPKPRSVYEDGVDNGLRPIDSLIGLGGDTETPVRSANDRQFEWTPDGQTVLKKPELKLVPQTEVLVKDISTTPVSMAEYEEAVAFFDAKQKEAERNDQDQEKTIPTLEMHGKQVVENHPPSSRNIDGQALIAKINDIEGSFNRSYEDEIGNVEKRDQESVKTQNRILELEKQYRDADSEERRRAIAEELRVENQILKRQLEMRIQIQETRLRDITDRKVHASPAEVMKIHARLKVYEDLVEDINHPGRREFQTAIVKLENELARYQESYLASDPKDPDVLSIKGKLQAYRALLAESMQEDGQVVRSEAVTVKAQLMDRLQTYRALLAENIQKDGREMRSEAITVSQSVPKKGINKIDSTKQTPQERSERKKNLLEKLRFFGWKRKEEIEDAPEIDNSIIEKTREERRQEVRQRFDSTRRFLLGNKRIQASAVESVPTTPVKENKVKTFAKKALRKVKNWFS